jgi:hypothetical protein
MLERAGTVSWYPRAAAAPPDGLYGSFTGGSGERATTDFLAAACPPASSALAINGDF